MPSPEDPSASEPSTSAVLGQVMLALTNVQSQVTRTLNSMQQDFYSQMRSLRQEIRKVPGPASLPAAPANGAPPPRNFSPAERAIVLAIVTHFDNRPTSKKGLHAHLNDLSRDQIMALTNSLQECAPPVLEGADHGLRVCEPWLSWARQQASLGRS